MRQPIVVGTDLTNASDVAVLRAEALATRDSVPLTVVHALEGGVWGVSSAGGTYAALREEVTKRVVSLTERKEGSFEVLVMRASPHLALSVVAAARGALVVVGAHTDHGLGHTFLRDVTARVAEQARQVYIAKSANPARRILIALASPLDDSATLDAGVEEARASGAALVVMHSVHMGFWETMAKDLVNGEAYAAHPLGERSLVVRARHQISAELARRGVHAELHVVDGPPEAMIIEAALRTHVELIVVGTAHAPAPLSHVAGSVLKHAPCSLLIVDAGAQAEVSAPQRAAV